MFFRNLTFFRFPAQFGGIFPSPLADEFDHLNAALQGEALKPIGAMELFRWGFVPALGEAYAHRVGNACHITLGGEEKLLPAAVVNDLLRKKLAEVEEREGRSPGGRARKRIKEQLIAELLPRAFVQPCRLDAWFDFDRNFIAVDTSSRRASELLVSSVRVATGSFPALPLNAETAPRAILTGWLAGEPLPAGLSLGDECELRDPSDKGAVVKVQHLELAASEVQQHLEAGRQCTRLALVLDDHVSFVLGEDLVIRKLRFLDGAVEALESSERDDLNAELDARFALMAGEVGRLFDLLEVALKLSRADDDRTSAANPNEVRAGVRVRQAVKRLHDLADEQQVTMTLSGPGMEPITFGSGDGPDPLYQVAVDAVVASQRASISRLQRTLKIGYNRAARLIESMETAGVVSAPTAGGDRTVLTTKDLV